MSQIENLLGNSEFKSRVDRLTSLLFESVRRRVVAMQKICKKCLRDKNEGCCHSKLGVLFSGDFFFYNSCRTFYNSYAENFLIDFGKIPNPPFALLLILDVPPKVTMSKVAGEDLQYVSFFNLTQQRKRHLDLL